MAERTRGIDEDDDPALVLAEEVAFGLSALQCPVYDDPRARWQTADDMTRDVYRAQARFVLAQAKAVDADFLERVGGRLRWRK